MVKNDKYLIIVTLMLSLALASVLAILSTYFNNQRAERCEQRGGVLFNARGFVAYNKICIDKSVVIDID
jgi:hypothetical protein